MNVRSATSPHGREDRTRLALWLALVAAMTALSYGSGKPPADALYRWASVANGLINEAILLVLVLAIASFRLDLFALRRPTGGWRRVAGTIGIALVAAYLFEIAYSALAHPGNEQGLTPDKWEASHALAYAANAAVICICVPFVEEMTFRGLGYTLLEPFGRWPAIVLVGVLFGLAHGLVVSFPVLAFFGCVLAWIRARLNSVVPGMVLHGAFNLVALVAAVTIQR